MKKIGSLVEIVKSRLKDSAVSSTLNILHSQSMNECRKLRYKHKFFFSIEKYLLANRDDLIDRRELNRHPIVEKQESLTYLAVVQSL